MTFGNSSLQEIANGLRRLVWPRQFFRKGVALCRKGRWHFCGRWIFSDSRFYGVSTRFFVTLERGGCGDSKGAEAHITPSGRGIKR